MWLAVSSIDGACISVNVLYFRGGMISGHASRCVTPSSESGPLDVRVTIDDNIDRQPVPRRARSSGAMPNLRQT
jgi:hypothetical protein